MAAYSASAYLERALELLAGPGVSPVQLVSGMRDELDMHAVVSAELRYQRGHVLDLVLDVDTVVGHPRWGHYTFHLRDRFNQCVFRYDNAPHHPDVETFPHHKHVGPQEIAVPSPEPTLSQLVSEIIGILQSTGKH